MSEQPKKIDCGGAAFPLIENGVCSQEGMSYRQWLAGMALSGLLSHIETTMSADTAAESALRYADAVIAALKEPNP